MTKKAIGKAWNAVSTILVALVVALAVLLVGVRVVGFTPYVVLSGSMEPTYHVGSMIYVKDVEPADIQVGDPITFRISDGMVATHRVVAIYEDGTFQTQGDANDAPDGAPVTPENLVGKPVFSIPYLGYVSDWIMHPPGIYLAGTAVVVLIILMFLPGILRKAEEADRREAEKSGGDDPHTNRSQF